MGARIAACCVFLRCFVTKWGAGLPDLHTWIQMPITSLNMFVAELAKLSSNVK